MNNIIDLPDHSTLFDSHAHLNINLYDGKILDILKKNTLNGVDFVFDMATNIESINKSISISKKYPLKVFSFVGIDPEVFIEGSDIFIGLEIKDEWFDEKYKELSEIIRNNTDQIKGIGETGLDYYWLRDKEVLHSNKSKRLQQKLFEVHLELASEFNLPLSIHTRGAELECVEILRKKEVKGILHSYTGDYEVAMKALDIGLGLGINGIITFKKSQIMREMYKTIIGNITSDITPEYFYDKGIYFETDSPFLSPEGMRGEINQPSNTKEIYNFVVNFLSNKL